MSIKNNNLNNLHVLYDVRRFIAFSCKCFLFICFVCILTFHGELCKYILFTCTIVEEIIRFFITTIYRKLI